MPTKVPSLGGVSPRALPADATRMLAARRQGAERVAIAVPSSRFLQTRSGSKAAFVLLQGPKMAAKFGPDHAICKIAPHCLRLVQIEQISMAS